MLLLFVVVGLCCAALCVCVIVFGVCCVLCVVLSVFALFVFIMCCRVLVYVCVMS